MSQVIVNNFTTQKPLTAFGSTGEQVLAMIPASRAFIKLPDSTTAAPVNAYADYAFKTNGQTPAGWSDLGIMDSPAKIVYTKNVEKVQTGIDKTTRKTYAKTKEATIEFNLWQTDDYLLSQLGFNGSVVTAGSSMSFFIGQEDVVQAALLVVYCNKLDGKELHVYNPNASLSVTFEDNGGKLMTKVVADLCAFTPAGDTREALYALNVFSTGIISYNAGALLRTVPYSPTANFDGSNGVTTFEMVLTGNVTAATFSNLSPAGIYTTIFVQDAVGGRVVNFLPNVIGATPVDPTPLSVTVQSFLERSNGTLLALAPATYN